MYFRNARIEPVLQEEPTECGLACVVMVANSLGNRTTLSSLRSRYPISSRGSSALNLVEIADHIGLTGRGMRVGFNNVRSIRKPAILHWRMNHFVVLVKITRSSFHIIDPAYGFREVSPNEFKDCFTGICLEFERRESIVDDGQADDKSSIMRYLYRNDDCRKWLLRVIAASFLLESAVIAMPIIQQMAIDRLFIDQQNDLLFLICFMAIAVICYRLLVTAMRETLLRIFQAQASLTMSTFFLERILSLPVQFIERRHASDITFRLQNARNAFTSAIRLFANTGLNTFFGFISLVIMFLYSSEMAMILMLSPSIYVICRWYGTKRMRALTGLRQQHSADAHEVFAETVKSYSHVRMSGMENVQIRKYNYILRLVVNIETNILRILANLKNIRVFLNGMELVVVIYWSFYLIRDGDMTIGMFVAFFNYYRHFSDATFSLVEGISEFMIYDVDFSRFTDIVNHDVEEDLQSQKVNIIASSVNNNISASDVSFTFPGEPVPIISNLDLKIEQNEKVAILGQSGCGKSTFLKLLAGLDIADKGRITIGGMSVSDIGYRSYRDLVTLVQQDEHLFTGTVLSNITCFADKVDQDRLARCNELVGLDRLLESLPMGLKTMVWGGGRSLSGGQIQRIILARAIYQNRPVMLLDEATAHLDEESEGEILRGIFGLNKTVIVVTHRRSSVVNNFRCVELFPRHRSATLA